MDNFIYDGIIGVYKQSIESYGYVVLYFLMLEYIEQERYEDCEELQSFFINNYIPVVDDYHNAIEQIFRKFHVTGSSYRDNIHLHLDNIKTALKKSKEITCI